MNYNNSIRKDKNSRQLSISDNLGGNCSGDIDIEEMRMQDSLAQIIKEEFRIGTWIIQHFNWLIITKEEMLLHLPRPVKCDCKDPHRRNNFKANYGYVYK